MLNGAGVMTCVWVPHSLVQAAPCSVSLARVSGTAWVGAGWGSTPPASKALSLLAAPATLRRATLVRCLLGADRVPTEWVKRGICSAGSKTSQANLIANWASLLQREQMGAFCLCVVCFAGRCHRSFFWESLDYKESLSKYTCVFIIQN